ncbi:hypothetical protein IVA80_16980 [Bradyrhizobium sp. 139]|uniref:hypothetical protein n=1 Tax=Bradyrhizobium sp. 139 TaxID=2782616 RepID=UPI001FFB7897|nr:hypothetical protein [Bradyrhizobium sp. 139]MCK1742513.1 hypothetical protein [Bradyrhizobium sp. 139]
MSPQAGSNATRFSVSLKSVRIAIALLQLVEELFEMRREPGFGAQALLKPFGHRIANRAAGASIDLFAVSSKNANHS